MDREDAALAGEDFLVHLRRYAPPLPAGETVRLHVERHLLSPSGGGGPDEGGTGGGPASGGNVNRVRIIPC